MYDQNNIFARILRGEIPSKKVMETANTLAFHDAFPKASVHILVIPKKPYITFHDFIVSADTQEVLVFYKTAEEIVRSQGLDKTGYKLQVNTGEVGGQEVPHFHMHIMG
jgi:diadenosine tetraphosphate (Ap4A) HIT family hydrolase